MTTDKQASQLHTCSYYCDRPECIKAQRDELRDKMLAAPKGEAVASIYISHHKAGENFDVDYWGSLPAGSHTLYTRPAPAEPQAVDAEWLERREQAAYEAGKQAVAQWQPIETAPKDGTAILVTDSFAYRSDPKKPHHVYRAVRWNEEGYGWEIYNDGEIIDQDGPTFWMPLPAEPGSMLSASPAAPAEREPLTQSDELQVVTAERDFWKQVANKHGATIAGLESSVFHLSRMFDEQIQMLVEVEKQLCLDGHYGPFEDGEHALCDRIRAHIAAHHIGKPKDVGINGLTEAETAASASVMGLTGKSQEPSP